MSEPIAVVGYACRFPGAPDAEGFWRLLAEGGQALTRFTDAELAARGVPESLRHNPSYVPVGGLLDDQDRFDPAAFGLSGSEAELLDPQHRVFLETAWHALEHAGHAGGRDAGSVGVFAGAAFSAYLATNLAHRFDPLGGADPAGNLQLHTGNVADYLPLRTAHRFGLTGPAIAVGATCATSLVGVHVAVQSLLAGECDTAIAGGVSLRVPQGLGHLYVPDGPFSADGVTRPYSADARGTVFTQGAGVVVLRRLADAQASRDHVHAVILGSAVANDGALRAGFTAPSADGQARTIAEALAVADVDPRTVSYVEGHGTGTVLGDPIEVQALRRVFGPAERPWCGLGSVKANIGHADSASGVAGLIKVILALAHRTLPASLHAHPVNPELRLGGSPFRIVHETEPWDTDGPRRAGVSSFGIGGTNCHVVLEEASPPLPSVRDDRAQLLVVSAATAEACRETARAVADGLAGDTADAAYTLALGRKEFAVRTAVTVAPGEDAAQALRFAPPAQTKATPKVVFAFSGGGSQYAGMCAGLYRDEPVFAKALDEIAGMFPADVRTVLLDPGAGARDPSTGLPALFTASVAMLRLLEDRGVRPDVVLGHSIGEYAAAVAAGVLSTSDAAALVAERSARMGDLIDGAMLAVPLGEERVTRLLREHPGLDLAAVNAEDACAVSGPRADVERLRAQLAAEGIRGETVGVDVAAHSRLVEPAMAALRAVARRLSSHPARIPLVTTLTGRVASDAELADPERWVRHLRGAVRFAEALDTALADGPAVVVQVGPGGMIATLAARRGVAVTTFPRRREGGDGRAAVLDALGRLWCHGVEIDHEALHEPGRRRIPLPGYAFQRERYWIDPAPKPAGDVSPGEPLQLPAWHQLPPLRPVAPPGLRVLGDGPWADALRAAAGDADPVAVVVCELVAGGEQMQRLTRSVLGFAELAGGELPLLQLTVNGESVVGTEEVDPVAAGVRGLPRVLAQESPGIRWRTLDVTGAPDDRLVGQVLAEVADLAAADGPRELALRGGKRWLREWEPWHPAKLGDLPAEPVVVVTGGLGNVGKALAQRLSPKAHVVLASRTARGLPELPPGHDVRAETVDVTDALAVGELLTRVAAEHGRIDLVVHAPVVIELAALSEVDEETVARSLAPKVAGTLALREAVETLPESARPRTVLLMSSAAGTIGGFGLGAYVAASRFADGFAHAMAGSTTRWIAVDWDRWRFGTAAERESAAEITMRHALDAVDAIAALLRLAAADAPPPQVAVSPTELNSRSLALGTRTTRVATGADDLVSAAEQLVAEVWSDTLGQPVTGRDDDFFALGGHSLLATRVLARLRDEHGITLRLRDLLARPTVAGLAELVAGAEPETVGPKPVVPVAEDGPFPLTRVQHAYWVGRAAGVELGEVGCHFYLEHEARDFDPARYEAAWNRVIARHPMLRSVITADGENLVLPEIPVYRVPVHELAEDGLAELRERLSRRVADPGRWPLVEAHVVRLPDGTHRVLLSVDVLVCDSASYLVVDRELRALYENPEAELPPLTTAFADCVAAIEGRRGSTDHRRAAEYWRNRLDTLPAAAPLPVRVSGERPRFARRWSVLSASQWARLRERAAALGVTPTAVLLAAYGDALAEWSRSDHFSLTLTVFDRPAVHPDVDKIVGEFSSLLLFEVDRRGLGSFADRAKAAQQRLFEDLDHAAYSGLEVLAEQARRTGKQRNVPVVFTSMLGLDTLGGEPHDHEWLGPIVHGVSQTPQVWLDHQVYERHGELVLQWDVAETSLDAEEADRVFADYVISLVELAEPDADWTNAATTDPVRTALADIWAELLDLDPATLAPGTSFVGAGGDSLLAVRMATLLRQRLNVVLTPAEIRVESTLSELASLVAERTADGPALRALDAQVRRRLDPAEPFELLPLQQAYFVGQQGGWDLSYTSAHVCTDIALSEVDAERAPAALVDALRRVVAHQPMLRARILPDGTQKILPHGEIGLDVVDFRDGGDLDHIREEMSRRGPDPTTGPPVEMRLVLLPDHRARLFTSFSLLVMDGWSAAVFERELLAYLADANTVLPPLLVDFGDYAQAMADIRSGPAWAQDRDWWWQRIDGMPAAPELPMIAEPGRVDSALMGAREARLPAPEWAALRAECARHDLTPTAVLLTAYAVALAGLAGQSRFLLNSLQANRLSLHPDVDRMIGAFSSTALIDVDLGKGGRFADLARGVRGEVAETLAHNLVAGVEVARELARRRGTRRPVAPVVFQSTLGMDAAVGGPRPERAGPLGRLDVSDYVQRIRTPQVFLELRVFELVGELVVNVAVVEDLFGPGVVDRLFTEVVGRTKELAAGGGWDDVVDLSGATASAWAEKREAVHSGAPTGAAEQAIARLWAELLGVSEVDRSADFFALGGDSLLAVRMLGRVPGGPVPPRKFLAEPTVAGLARALSGEPHRDEIAVPLKDGTGSPLFLLHPSGGDVLCYGELVRRLDVPNPVVALTDPGLTGGDGPEDISEMVRHYLAVIRARQPHGPYLLGGWSMGGTVGHEVACALRSAGERVALLVMIDSNSPERIVALEGLDGQRSEEEFQLRYLRSLEAFLGFDYGPGHDAESLRRRLSGEGLTIDPRRVGVFARHLRGLAAHHASRLDETVPVLLLRAGAVSPRNSRVGMGVDDSFDDRELGWGPFVAGPLTVEEIDAHHYSILHDPALHVVASHLTDALKGL